MDGSLIEYQSKLLSLKNQIFENVAPYMTSSKVLQDIMDSINRIYDSKLYQTKPKIMVYGIFNAGKSSIINELVGEDVALVRDIPTTDVVTKYLWNGYEIYDTPGVDAPIDNEYVTNQQLQESDVVLFVMCSNGPNELSSNYVRMKDIVDSGKRIIIVLNDKDGYLFHQDDLIEQIKDKIKYNMANVGINDSEKKYCIVTVNALRAKKGRDNNEEIFTKESNISELSSIIMQEIKNTKSTDILVGIINEVESFVSDILNELQVISTEVDTQGLVRIMNDISEIKINIRQSIGAFIEKKSNDVFMNLSQIIWEKRNNGEAVINETVNNEIRRMSKLIERKVFSEICDASNTLLVELNNEYISNDAFSFEHEDINVSSHHNNVSVENNYIEFEDIIEGLKKISTEMEQLKQYESKGNVSKSLDGVGTNALLATQAIQTVATTEIGKSLLGPTIAKFIATPIPGGPIVTAIPLLIQALSYFSRKAQEKREQEEAVKRYEVEREIQMREEIHQKCLYMSGSYTDAMKVTVDEILNAMISDILKPIKEKKNKFDFDSQKTKDCIANLQNIKDQYNRIRNMLVIH